MCDDKTWALIKAEYIAGGTSYAALAEKYGISKASIQRRGMSDGWQNLRQSIRSETESQVKSYVAKERTDRFLQLYSMADRFQDRMQQLLDTPVRNARQAHDMVDALNGTVQLLRDLYGLPSEQQLQGRERLAIMREDLQLKKQQLERENETNDDIERWVVEMGDDDE